MTALRRLLHRFGVHWWSRWRKVAKVFWPDDTSIIVVFERRNCGLCPREDRRVREVDQWRVRENER